MFPMNKPAKKMSIETILILAAIGLIAGFLGGFVGIGGGMVMVPALVFLLAVDQKTAQGTSLAVLMLPIGLLAVMNYYKADHVNFRYAFVIAALFVVGSFVGSKVAVSIDGQIVKRIFGVFLALMAVKFIFGK